jgi:hypothetical protein
LFRRTATGIPLKECFSNKKLEFLVKYNSFSDLYIGNISFSQETLAVKACSLFAEPCRLKERRKSDENLRII